MAWMPRRRKIEKQLSEILDCVAELSNKCGAIQRRLEALDNLVRDLHTDSWNANALRTEAVQAEIQSRTDRLHDLVTQNHADTWNADEKRALGLADVVLISLTSQVESIKQDLIALVGEKAVEVFHEVSHHG